MLEAGYGEVQVLWGISLGASRGQLTTIIGANGVGKTTALRAIAGSIRPWGGRVLFDGKMSRALRRTARPRAASSTCPRGGNSSTPCRSRKTGDGRLHQTSVARLFRPPGAGVYALSANDMALKSCRPSEIGRAHVCNPVTQ